MQKSQPEPVVIKRYGNRRLYDTVRSCYVNLGDLRALVRSGAKIRVIDASTEEDVTRRVLTQIVLEAAEEDEKAGLPLDLLYQLAQASDRAFRDFLDWYLKSSMEVYQRLQERWQEEARRRWGEARPQLDAWARLWDPRQVAASLAQLLSPLDPRAAGAAARRRHGDAGRTAGPRPEEGPGEGRGPAPARGGLGASDAGSSGAPPPEPDEAARDDPQRELLELRRRLDQLERRLAAARGEGGEPPPDAP